MAGRNLILKMNFQNILIVRTDRIGDLILTTPAIAALRKGYPRARFSLLVAPKTRCLIEDHPGLDEVWVDDRQGKHRGLRGFFRLAGELKKRHFDLAVIYHTKKRTNSLCLLAGIPYRLGYRNNKLGFLLTDGLKDERHWGRRHEVEYCLDVLKVLGIQTQESALFISRQAESERWAEEWLQAQPVSDPRKLIAVHPGASCPTKMWPAQRFADLLRRLSQKDQYHFLLIGDKDLRKVSIEIKRLAQIPIGDMTGQTSLSQLVSLMSRCRMLISNDSGPVHIANALMVPVVSIFTRNQPGINPERWRPWQEPAKIVCAHYEGPVDLRKGRLLDSAFLEKISTEEVLQAVDSLLAVC